MKPEEANLKSDHGGNHDLSHVIGIHQPIFLLSRNTVTDTVVFKCTDQFVVDVEFDDEVPDPSASDDPTRSPFGWATPQTGVFADAGPNGQKPSDYLFYKATVWSDNLKLDPDFFCDR